MSQMLPNEWQFVELGKVCRLPERQVRPSEFSKYDHYVGLEHIEGGTGRIIEYKKVSEANLKSSKFHFDTSCILYGKLRPYLNKVALPTVTGICSTDILPLKPFPELISREFLFYFLRSSSFVKVATEKSTGANLPRIGPEVLLSIPIPLPSMKTQTKVAQTLATTDQLRQRREQANKLTNKIIQSAFLKMFGDPATNPMKWKIVTIGDIVTETQYGLSKGLSDNPKHVPIVRMNNITTDGYLDLTEMRYVDVTKDEEEKYKLHNGDILFNRTNSRELVGKTGLVTTQRDLVFASYLIRVRTDAKLSTPEYLWSFLNSNHGKRVLLRMARGAVGQANINAQELRSIVIALPPLDLQERFAKVLHHLEPLKADQRQSTLEINELFRSLMYKAFSGELGGNLSGKFGGAS